MKKLFSIILALSMTVTLLCNPALAAREAKDDPDFGSEIAVQIKFDDGNLNHKYSLSIEFEDMKFTYHEGERTWNPNDYNYDTDDADGQWVGNGGITMINHSDQAVRYTVTAQRTVDTYGDLSIEVDANTRTDVIAACEVGATSGVPASTSVSVSGTPSRTLSQNEFVPVGKVTVAFERV